MDILCVTCPMYGYWIGFYLIVIRYIIINSYLEYVDYVLAITLMTGFMHHSPGRDLSVLNATGRASIGLENVTLKACLLFK